jgi:hypothetical protein
MRGRLRWLAAVVLVVVVSLLSWKQQRTQVRAVQGSAVRQLAAQCWCVELQSCCASSLVWLPQHCTTQLVQHWLPDDANYGKLGLNGGFGDFACVVAVGDAGAVSSFP